MDESGPSFATVHDTPRRPWMGVVFAFCVLAVALLVYAAVLTVIALGLRANLDASNSRAACRADLSAQVDVVLIDELNQFNQLLADLSVQPRNQDAVTADLAAFQLSQARVQDVRSQRANTATTCDRNA